MTVVLLCLFLYREKYGANIEDPPSRSNEVTGTYARACIEIGRECRVSVIDLWSSMQQESIWETRFLRYLFLIICIDIDAITLEVLMCSSS